MTSLQFKMRKSFVLLMGLLLVFSMFIPVVEASDYDGNLYEVQEIDEKVSISEDRSTEVTEKIEQALEKSKQYYKDIQPNGTNSHSDYWLFSALWSADINLKEFPWGKNGSPWEEDTFWTNGKESETRTSNEDAGIIIGSILLGQDPEKFGQRNIVQDLIGKQKDDGSFFTIWGEPWAMIALDLVDADYDREKHIAYMLGKQSNGTFGGVDSNGWILTALAPYKDERQDVKEAIELAVQAVHEGYQEKGDIFDSWGANSNSTAAALMGLAAVGEDLLSSKWTKDGSNIIEQFIETYQQEDGSFWWQENMAGAVSMATEQSLLALATVAQGESVFVRLKEQGISATVQLQIEGILKSVIEKRKVAVKGFGQKTALDLLKKELDQAKIDYVIEETEWGAYLKAIAGEEAGCFGGYDGWNFMVNGASPIIGAGDYLVKDGDHVVWFYGNSGDIYKGNPSADEVEKLTLNPKIAVASELSAGDEIEVLITAAYNIYDENFELEQENVETPVKQADIYFNGKIYKTDENGKVRIPGEAAKVGEYEIRVTKDIEGSYPRLLRQAKKVIIEERPNGGDNPKPDPVETSVKSPDYIKTAIKDGKIEIQIEDKVTGEMKPALIEHSESVGGYLIVQIGDQGKEVTSIKLSPEDTHVVVLDNDHPYSYFDIGIDTAAIKEWEVKFSAPLLNEPENFAKITVQDAMGEKVDATVTLSEDGTTVMITPDIPYEKGELYYITITDVVAADGKIQKKSIRKIFIVE